MGFEGHRVLVKGDRQQFPDRGINKVPHCCFANIEPEMGINNTGLLETSVQLFALI